MTLEYESSHFSTKLYRTLSYLIWISIKIISIFVDIIWCNWNLFTTCVVSWWICVSGPCKIWKTEVECDLHCNVTGGRLFSKKGVHGREAAFRFHFYPCTALDAPLLAGEGGRGGVGARVGGWVAAGNAWLVNNIRCSAHQLHLACSE